MLHHLECYQQSGRVPGVPIGVINSTIDHIDRERLGELHYDVGRVKYVQQSDVGGVPKPLKEMPTTIAKANHRSELKNHQLPSDCIDGVEDLVMKQFPGIDSEVAILVVKAVGSYNVAIANSQGQSLRIHSARPNSLWVCIDDTGFLCHGSTDPAILQEKLQRSRGVLTQAQVNTMLRWNPMSVTGTVRKIKRVVPDSGVEIREERDEEVNALRAVTHQAADVLCLNFDVVSQASGSTTAGSSNAPRNSVRRIERESVAPDPDWKVLSHTAEQILGRPTDDKTGVGVDAESDSMAPLTESSMDRELFVCLQRIKHKVDHGLDASSATNPLSVIARRLSAQSSTQGATADAPDGHDTIGVDGQHLAATVAREDSLHAYTGMGARPVALLEEAEGGGSPDASLAAYASNDDADAGNPIDESVPGVAVTTPNDHERSVIERGARIVENSVTHALADALIKVVSSDLNEIKNDNVQPTVDLLVQTATNTLGNAGMIELAKLVSEARRSERKKNKKDKGKERSDSIERKPKKEKKEGKSKGHKHKNHQGSDQRADDASDTVSVHASNGDKIGAHGVCAGKRGGPLQCNVPVSAASGSAALVAQVPLTVKAIIWAIMTCK